MDQDPKPRPAGVPLAKWLGGFSLSPSEVEAVAEYIDHQEEHHRTVSFQEEYRKFLQTYGVEYDERYVWD